MTASMAESGLQIQSTLDGNGTLRIALADVPVAEPGQGQVIVRVEAAPINPSDIMPMLAGGDPAQARFAGSPERPEVELTLPPAAAQANAGRVGHPLAIGLEGAGAVVAAGSGSESLLGKRVAFLSLGTGSLGQYCMVSATDCMPLPDDVTCAEGADLFCNPMTALAMVETLHQTGQTAMVHTAAASNLGQMLVKICREDGIPLVNVVRRKEQADMLRSIGAQHVCDSSLPTFADDLADAVRATGATVAFDAIGGGKTASILLAAMEKAAAARMPAYSPYGSAEMKRVYVYGHLEPGPTSLPRHGYGMLWSVEGWAMPPILERAGQDRTLELTMRVANNLKTTFAASYGREITLAEVLQRDVMLGYCKQSTGQKVLVRPWGVDE